MEKARLLHKASMSYLQTSLPVNFYGLPDGKVYLLYSRFYSIRFEKPGLEFVFAKHQEFSYDYKYNQLYLISSKKKLPVLNETVDKPEPKIKILKVYRSFNSYGEALEHLNTIAATMIKKKKDSKRIKVLD